MRGGAGTGFGSTATFTFVASRPIRAAVAASIQKICATKARVTVVSTRLWISTQTIPAAAVSPVAPCQPRGVRRKACHPEAMQANASARKRHSAGTPLVTAIER